jgi:hypothetical protein
MESDEKEILEKTLELSQDNNKILHSIKRGMFWSRVMSVIYWIIIIGVSVGVYYYIQPYIDSLLNTYESVKGEIQNLSNTIKPN